MSSRRRELVETLTGDGELRSDRQHVADVTYTVQVHRDVIDAGGSELAGKSEASGWLRADGHPQIWDRDGMVLHLEDGQQMPIVFGRININVSGVQTGPVSFRASSLPE